jgi:hypothetical protein
VKPQIRLNMNENERVALRSFSAEERKVVLDQILATIRDDLEWLFALEAARDAPSESRKVDPSPLHD